MSASVSDVRMPADLLDRAVRRNRKRTMRNGLMGAVAAAGVLAAVVAIAVGWTPGHHPASAQPVVRPHLQHPATQPPTRQEPTQHPTQHPQLLTTAYVVEHVATALTNSYRMISVDRMSGGMDHGSVTYTDVATQ